MPVDPVNGAGNALNTLGGAAKKDTLGQEAFLQLMITQLRNQDPLKPADPSEFLGQLAQFGTVTGIQSMQDSLSTLSSTLRSSQVLGGTTLVDRDVLVAAEDAALGETGEIYGTTLIPEDATRAELIVTDASGQLVRRMPLSSQEGEVGFVWDGTDDRGQRADAGIYSFSTIATVGGAASKVETRLIGHVGSVTIDPKNYDLTLNTSLGAIPLSQVRRVM